MIFPIYFSLPIVKFSKAPLFFLIPLIIFQAGIWHWQMRKKLYFLNNLEISFCTKYFRYIAISALDRVLLRMKFRQVISQTRKSNELQNSQYFHSAPNSSLTLRSGHMFPFAHCTQLILSTIS